MHYDKFTSVFTYRHRDCFCGCIAALRAIPILWHAKATREVILMWTIFWLVILALLFADKTAGVPREKYWHCKNGEYSDE